MALLALILVLLGDPLHAHHGSDHGSIGTGAIDPFTGRSQVPASYLMLLVDETKAAKNNRNVITTTLFGEVALGDSGIISLNALVPYHYYDQPGRKDAARYGKVYIGGKLTPFQSYLNPFYLVFDSRLGFPTGSDTDHLTAEDFWDGIVGMTVGVTVSRFSMGFRLGGQFPLSRLTPRQDPEYENVPYYLRGGDPKNPEPDAEQLRKVTEGSVFLQAKLFDGFSMFTGYYIRTPYNGIVWNQPSKRPNYLVDPFISAQYYYFENYDPFPVLPKYYREASVGASYSFLNRYAVTATYRYPLVRKQVYRLYESVVSVGFTMRFGNFHYHSFKAPEEKHQDEEASKEKINEKTGADGSTLH